MSTSEMVVAYEGAIRLGCFVGVLALVALWELAAPRRVLRESKRRRWLGNFAVLLLNTLLLRAIFPAAAVGAAVFAATHGWGVLNWVVAPAWLSVIAAVVALDLAIYLQHVLFHAVPAFWRLHRMHHADLDIDVSTGGRFHPLEILLSMLIKFGVIFALGAPMLAVVIFEVMLSATSLFNHGNLLIPSATDRFLRWFVVTPDMHRVHHSIAQEETNSNFGFNFPWWDRLFGTYRDQPKLGHRQMAIGIRTFRDRKYCQDLTGMLAIPFVGGVSAYAINRRSSEASADSNAPYVDDTEET